jgi:tRNA modification GTPase
MSTIFAVSSGAPPAAIAILRLSGAGAFAAVRMLAGDLPPPRRAALRALRDPADGALIDRAFVLLFPAPRSATGEDVAELHLHGGRATVRAAMAALARIEGLRAAEPGEFTRRALMNARIDLSEAEGLGDLLMAETEAQRRAALMTAEGGVRRRVEGWRVATLECAAQIELLLDHADEEDAGDEQAVVNALRDRIAALQQEIAVILAEPPVERLRDGIRVVLGGPPNSGKSTLFNAMAGRDAAIVSPIAGTTRDRIEAPIVREGVAWLLVDTAGLTEVADDPIEAIGIGRSHEAMAAADIVLWLGDGEPPSLDAEMIAVHARADLPGRGEVPDGRVAVTAVDGDVAGVWHALRERAAALLPRADALALNRRQRELLEEAERQLGSAQREDDLLLTAEALRCARNAFDAITGRAGVEELLDALFGRFCIGK